MWIYRPTGTRAKGVEGSAVFSINKVFLFYYYYAFWLILQVMTLQPIGDTHVITWIYACSIRIVGDIGLFRIDLNVTNLVSVWHSLINRLKGGLISPKRVCLCFQESPTWQNVNSFKNIREKFHLNVFLWVVFLSNLASLHTPPGCDTMLRAQARTPAPGSSRQIAIGIRRADYFYAKRF